jgi:hypothetical protein
MSRRITLLAGMGLTILTSVALAQQPTEPKKAVTEDEVRRDPQQASFNNVEFLKSAYVVRKTNRYGAKVVSDNAEQGSSLVAPNSDAGISGRSNKSDPETTSSGT